MAAPRRDRGGQRAHPLRPDDRLPLRRHSRSLAAAAGLIREAKSIGAAIGVLLKERSVLARGPADRDQVRTRAYGRI